jgi:aerobic carbon-monoxide dehydrogenase medium subunit
MTAEFTIETPTAVGEVLELLSGSDSDVRPIAGGTGLTPLIRYGFVRPACLVSLRRLPESCRRIESRPDGCLHIGATATLRELERTAVVAAHAPVLIQALRRLSTIRIRNVATIGGTLAHGHPQLDLPQVLIALDAEVLARSVRGERWIAVDDLLQGYYVTALADDEFIEEIRIPPLGDAVAHYQKLTARTFEDWPMLGLAVRLRRAGDLVTDVRVVVGAQAERPRRLREVEDFLAGSRLDAAVIAEAAARAAADVTCHDDQVASAEYRRVLVRINLAGALRALGPSEPPRATGSARP